MNEEDADIIELRQNFNNLLEIFIKIKNVDGLFLNLVKIFGALGVEIIDADISTTKDKKIALNTFIASYKYQSIKLTQADTKSLSTKIKAIHSGSKKLNKINTDFIIEPYIRFKGLPGEQATMFFMDPENNALEFKAFKDINQLFAK